MTKQHTASASEHSGSTVETRDFTDEAVSKRIESMLAFRARLRSDQGARIRFVATIGQLFHNYGLPFDEDLASHVTLAIDNELDQGNAHVIVE